MGLSWCRQIPFSVPARIKICGLRDPASARAAIAAGADALGFVFVKSSPRYVDPADAWAVIGTLPPFVASVGVYQDFTVEQFCDNEEVCPTNYAQLHGHEEEDTARRCGPGVIKAIGFEASTIAAELRRWGSIDEVDALLIDNPACALSRRHQYDLANHLFHAADYQTAADAYERFLAAYPNDREAPQVKLLLGRINASYLNDPVEAKWLFGEVVGQLQDEESLALAKRELADLG